MNYLKFACILSLLATLVGCASIDCTPNKPRTGYALPGTKTVVIAISVDKNGVPQESYKDIVLYPGQTALFAGPDQFTLVFKDRKTPNGKIENRSVNGALSIKIPEGIFEQTEFLEEGRKNNALVFDYVISVNGKELDPPMTVKKQN